MLRSVLVALILLAVGCASADPDDDTASTTGQDGETAGGDGDSSEDALTTREVTAYAAVAPPEHRVSTAKIAALVGEPLAAGRSLAIIRTATFQGQAGKLVIDESSFATALVSVAALNASSTVATASDTPWTESLAAVSARGDALRHLASLPAGVSEPFALTVDMCQSHKPWEKRLFDWAVALSDQLKKPTPLGIAMTGVWAKAHPTELDQLLAWQRAGKLDITWVNHSSTHPLHCLDAACRNATFLTDPSVDMDEEVLGEERTILARGMAPSVLFRFPGLIHDAERLSQLGRLSMMPLDADGWIAKGQPIAPGAVVLVHGNGNEPEGITGFLKQVAGARAGKLASGQTELVSPLYVTPTAPSP